MGTGKKDSSGPTLAPRAGGGWPTGAGGGLWGSSPLPARGPPLARTDGQAWAPAVAQCRGTGGCWVGQERMFSPESRQLTKLLTVVYFATAHRVSPHHPLCHYDLYLAINAGNVTARPPHAGLRRISGGTARRNAPRHGATAWFSRDDARPRRRTASCTPLCAVISLPSRTLST
jgi:hypothetical protein